MTGLELTYRFLMRAYPASHRERYEEEMVSVLLDATSRRHRLSAREATAIVASGIGIRLRGGGELHSGLQLASLGATATIVALTTVAWSLSIRQVPPLSAAVPAISWLLAAVVAIFGSRSTSKFRVAPPAAVCLFMIVAGPELMGFKRSVLAAAALCLVYTSIAPRLGLKPSAAASVVGVGAGMLFAIPNQAALDNWAPLSAGPWAASAHWQHSAYTLDTLSIWLAVPMVGFGLLALRWRSRYLLAGLMLSAALWLPVTLTPGGYFWAFDRSVHELLVGAAAAAAAAVLGLAVVVPWRAAR